MGPPHVLSLPSLHAVCVGDTKKCSQVRLSFLILEKSITHQIQEASYSLRRWLWIHLNMNFATRCIALDTPLPMPLAFLAFLIRLFSSYQTVITQRHGNNHGIVLHTGCAGPTTQAQQMQQQREDENTVGHDHSWTWKTLEPLAAAKKQILRQE